MYHDPGWGYVKAGLVGAFVAALVMMSVPVVAAVGDALKLGQANTANQVTDLSGSAAAGNLRLTNNLAGAPALNLKVTSGSAPFKVDSGAWVRWLNADRLDGRDADQLRAISSQCQNDSIPAGSNWTCTMTITIPRAGYLLMSGSVDIYETSGAGSSPWCTFSIDGTVLPASHRYLYIDQWEAGVCSSEIRGQRGAGTYTVTFDLGGVGAASFPDDGSAWVLFIPA